MDLVCSTSVMQVPQHLCLDLLWQVQTLHSSTGITLMSQLAQK